MLFRKIVWAVDVLEEAENRRNALFVLGNLVRATKAEVVPTYVLGPPYVHFAKEPPENIELAFHALADQRLREISKDSDISTMSTGDVVVNRTGSVRKDVLCLIGYALKHKADLLVVATHGRKGIERLLLGSFAETALMQSTLPVITVNPAATVRERISHILFPTDFEQDNREGFERTIALAKALEAKVTVFYKEPLLMGPYYAPEIYQYIEQENVFRKKAAGSWVEWADHQGVATDLKFDTTPGYPGGAIQKFAGDHNVDLISIVSHATDQSSFVTGSLVRQIVRGAPCPVHVLRSRRQS